MTKYKSKLRIPIMLEEQKLKEKEEIIAKVNQKITEIYEKIQEEEKKDYLIRQELSKGAGIPSTFFMNSSNYNFIQKCQKEINQYGQILNIHRTEYQILKKKRDKLLEVDKQREKLFYLELSKREQKKAENIKVAMKFLENGGEN